MGASAPTEPPKPIVIVVATIDVHVLCVLSLPFFFDIAYSTRLTP